MILLPALSTGQPIPDVIHHTDLLTLCAALPSASVDMILADLPYGTTACTWDTVIPFEPMWAAFRRVIKPRGAIILTASQPFTSRLVCSNLEMFRYEWVWDKAAHNNFVRCHNEPLKQHENILVFCEGDSFYQPQMVTGTPYRTIGHPKVVSGKTTGTPPKSTLTINDGWRYPVSIIKFLLDEKIHPTQKPVDLFSYLIRTYTQPGDLVLDPVVGSGTTAIAARNTGRHFICGDSSAEYVAIAKKRLAEPYTMPLFVETATPEIPQPIPLFALEQS